MYESLFWLGTDGILFSFCEIVIIFETGFVHGMHEDSKAYSQILIIYSLLYKVLVCHLSMYVLLTFCVVE